MCHKRLLTSVVRNMQINELKMAKKLAVVGFEPTPSK